MTNTQSPSPPGIDGAGLRGWLADTLPDLLQGALTITAMAGGRSNLTYRIDGTRVPLVVRRPPLGHVLASAHDMRREHRIISALHTSTVPVPPAVAFHDDTSERRVTGTPFFLMGLVEGQVLTRPSQNASYSATELHALGLDLVRVLAELHTTDPQAVGLADFGRGEQYLARQLRTWHRQLNASRSRETSDLDQLATALSERIPATSNITIVHGDYRLDNAIVAVAGEGHPHVAAVLDWEMSTIGDPLVDLGMLGLYWNIEKMPGASGLMPTAVDEKAGYPSFDELVDAYAARANIATPILGWYSAFAAYKLAVIAEGIHFRWQQGNTVGSGFEHVGEAVQPLAASGLLSIATQTNDG